MPAAASPRAIPRALFASVVDGLAPDATANQVSAAIREIRIAQLDDLVIEALRARRTEGVLRPCQNLGLRDDPILTVWNRFVGGAEITIPHERKSLVALLNFEITDIITRPAFDSVRDGLAKGAPRLVDSEKLRANLAAAEDRLEDLLTTGTLRHPKDCEFPCSLTGDRYKIEMEAWEPLLIQHDYETRQTTILNAVCEGKPILHLELDLPTGELILADWFRLPGFNDLVDAKLDGDHFNTENLVGQDERINAILEKVGFLSVPVSNTSPQIFRDGDLLRLGTLDEDLFYDAEGEPLGTEPKPLGRVTTDLWWASMIDRQRLTELLIESGHFEAETAPGAIDAWLKTTHGATEIRMEPGPLHLYIAKPGDTRLPQPNPFQEAGLPAMHGLTDRIVLSRTPLDLDPGLVRRAPELPYAEIWAWPEAATVYDSVDGPSCFRARVEDMDLDLLVHLLDEKKGRTRYMASMPSPEDFAALEAGEIDLRYALHKGGRLLLETTDHQTAKVTIMRGFPDNWRPAPGVRLLRPETEATPSP